METFPLTQPGEKENWKNINSKKPFQDGIQAIQSCAHRRLHDPLWETRVLQRSLRQRAAPGFTSELVTRTL